MSEPTILFVKPGAVKSTDKTALRKAGVVVIEIDDPQNVKFIRANAELSSGALLALAAQAILKSPYSQVRESFGLLVANSLARPLPPAPTEDTEERKT